jgi:hypothetical protein
VEEEEWNRIPQTSGRLVKPPRLPPTAVGTATLPSPEGLPRRFLKRMRRWFGVVPRLIAGIVVGVFRALTFAPRLIHAGLTERSLWPTRRARRRK